MVAAAKRNSCAALAARRLAALIALLTIAMAAPCRAQSVPAPAPEEVSFSSVASVSSLPSSFVTSASTPMSSTTPTIHRGLHAHRAAASAGDGASRRRYAHRDRNGRDWSTTPPTRTSRRSTVSSRAASSAPPRACGRSWPPCINHADERSGPEIDARVLRRETSFSGGAEFRLTGITSLTALYRYSTRATATERSFSRRSWRTNWIARRNWRAEGEVLRYTVDHAVVDVEFQRDRFETSPIRDADSVRVMPAAEFAPDAVIEGRTAAGFRRFSTARLARSRRSRALLVAANVTYSLLGVTRFTIEALRDVMYSFDVATPYFLLTSGRHDGIAANRRTGRSDRRGKCQIDFSIRRSMACRTASRLDPHDNVRRRPGFRLGQSLRLATHLRSHRAGVQRAGQSRLSAGTGVRLGTYGR